MDVGLVWQIIVWALVLGYVALVVYLGIDLVRRDLNIVAKIVWVVAFLAFPVFSVIVYVIVRGDAPTSYPGRSRLDVSNVNRTGGSRLR